MAAVDKCAAQHVVPDDRRTGPASVRAGHEPSLPQRLAEDRACPGRLKQGPKATARHALPHRPGAPPAAPSSCAPSACKVIQSQPTSTHRDWRSTFWKSRLRGRSTADRCPACVCVAGKTVANWERAAIASDVSDKSYLPMSESPRCRPAAVKTGDVQAQPVLPPATSQCATSCSILKPPSCHRSRWGRPRLRLHLTKTA
jgi:hypothetical protein